MSENPEEVFNEIISNAQFKLELLKSDHELTKADIMRLLDEAMIYCKLTLKD